MEIWLERVNMGKLIYIVEDEKHIQELIKFNLEDSGYDVEAFGNGEDLLNRCRTVVPNLFVLDIMLPGIDGLEICRRIHQDAKLKKTPVIMLTAKGDEFDRVLGLELGADDYITKPFSVREFTARVKAVLRRTDTVAEEESNDVISARDIVMDLSSRKVYKSNKMIEMSFKEFEILKLLILNKGKVMSREVLLEKIWGYDYFGETRTVDVHIRYLRQKIEDEAEENKMYIETVRGIGYRFTD
jgi:two-component system alkaline phosphatase synthesis response regulator PhoP